MYSHVLYGSWMYANGIADISQKVKKNGLHFVHPHKYIRGQSQLM